MIGRFQIGQTAKIETMRRSPTPRSVPRAGLKVLSGRRISGAQRRAEQVAERDWEEF